jgi:serine/threonine protein kinase
VARFDREVEVVARLNHTNVVRVLHAAEDAGRHYLAMELVERGHSNNCPGKDFHRRPHSMRKILGHRQKLVCTMSVAAQVSHL